MRKFGVPAIVLGGGVTTGLGAIRSLGRAGIDVYYIDDETTEAAYSKYCRKCFILPRRSNSKDELKNALAKLHDSIEYAVLFPGSDSYALNLSELTDELGGYYLPAPKKEATDLLIKKRRFYQSLTKEKIPHPTTHFPQDVEDVREIGRRVLYPVFVKPSVSHLFSQRFRKKGFVANSEGALLRYWTATEKEEVEVIIQEIVPGPPHNHVFLDGYIDSDSNPKALFARRRLRMWPLSFGNSSLCMSIPISEVASLKEILFNYLRSINYQGIFSAEFKKDQRDGVFKLLEINSRTSAWFNTLSAKCGINLMLVAYLDALGKDLEYSEDYEVGIKWAFLRDDLMAALRMMLDGDLSSGEWISSLRGKKEYDTYSWDDLRPFLMSLPSNILRTLAISK